MLRYWEKYKKQFQPVLKEKFAEKFKQELDSGTIRSLGVLFGLEEAISAL